MSGPSARRAVHAGLAPFRRKSLAIIAGATETPSIDINHPSMRKEPSMNTTRRLTHLTMIAALAAAAVMAAGVADRSEAPAASAPMKTVRLDTVVVTGHRAPADAMPIVARGCGCSSFCSSVS